MERIHRLGRKAPNKSRPVILRLYDFNQKLDILKNARKLKGTSISISDDFSRRVQMIRKQLWMTVKDSRRPEDKVSLRYDKLVINNETYIWDMDQMRRVKITGTPGDDRN